MNMKYGIQAATPPDSMWGRTIRWRSGRHGQPLTFDTMEQAQEAAKAFNDQLDSSGISGILPLFLHCFLKKVTERLSVHSQ